MELIFEKSAADKNGIKLPQPDVPSAAGLDDKYTRRSGTGLPNVSEPEVIRHYTRMSRLNFSIDTNFYPSAHAR